MKILFLTISDQNRASTRHRVFQYLPYLKEKEIQYRIHSLGAKMNLFQFAKEFPKTLRDAAWCDIIFIQKIIPSLPTQYLIKSFKKKLVFDFDDAIYLHFNCDYILKNSDLIIVGSHFLQDYSKKFNNNVVIIPTPVDTKEFHPISIPKKDKDYVSIGWIGDGTSHINNLKLLANPFHQLRDRKVELKIVGAKGEIEIYNTFNGMKGVKIIDWIDPQKVPEEISTFDIGVMPLTNAEYSAGKCARKALEYMAMGIPVVLSPVGENNYLIKDGQNGFLAATGREWVEKLSKLIENKVLRQNIGKAGLKSVEEKYSLKMNSVEFLTAIENNL